MNQLKTLPTDIYHLSIKQHNADSADFVLRKLEGEEWIAEVRGHLRRWEGTLTRVDCEMRERRSLLNWLLIITAMLVVSLVMLPFILLTMAGMGTVLWLVLGGFALTFVLVWVYVGDHFAPLDDTPGDMIGMIEELLT